MRRAEAVSRRRRAHASPACRPPPAHRPNLLPTAGQVVVRSWLLRKTQSSCEHGLGGGRPAGARGGRAAAAGARPPHLRYGQAPERALLLVFQHLRRMRGDHPAPRPPACGPPRAVRAQALHGSCSAPPRTALSRTAEARLRTPPLLSVGVSLEALQAEAGRLEATDLRRAATADPRGAAIVSAAASATSGIVHRQRVRSNGLEAPTRCARHEMGERARAPEVHLARREKLRLHQILRGHLVVAVALDLRATCDARRCRERALASPQPAECARAGAARKPGTCVARWTAIR